MASLLIFIQLIWCRPYQYMKYILCSLHVVSYILLILISTNPDERYVKLDKLHLTRDFRHYSTVVWCFPKAFKINILCYNSLTNSRYLNTLIEN